MWQTLRENVIAPLARRLGTATAVVVAQWGVEHQGALAVETAVSALLLVGADLLISRWDKTSFREMVLRGLR